MGALDCPAPPLQRHQRLEEPPDCPASCASAFFTPHSSPKVVYLDSSDYSNLATAAADGSRPDGPRWLAVRERIRAAKSEGKAVFRFSYSIIMEAYPTAPEHLPQALGRARAITETCGPCCMLMFTSLVAEEGKAVALEGSPPPRAVAWRNDGAWHPGPDELIGKMVGDLAPTVAESMRAALKETAGLTRNQRRWLERALLTREGSLSPEAAFLLTPEHRRSVTQQLAERFLLPQWAVDADIPARVMLGELPPSALGEVVLEVLRNPATLFAQQAVREHEASLFQWLRGFGFDIAESLRRVRTKMMDMVAQHGLVAVRPLAQERGPLVSSDEWVERTRAKALAAVWEAEAVRLRGAGLSEKDWQSRVVGSAFGSLPALDALLGAARHHAFWMLEPSSTLRQPRDSDGGDLMHMLYLPYADVFRCDRYGSGIAEKVVKAQGLGTRVASTIEDALLAVGA